MCSFHSIEYCLTLKRNDADPKMIKYQPFHKIQVFFTINVKRIAIWAQTF